MERCAERQAVPHFLQQDTCVNLYAGLNLYVIKGGDNAVFLLDAEFVAIHQDQQVNVTVGTGIPSRLQFVCALAFQGFDGGIAHRYQVLFGRFADVGDFSEFAHIAMFSVDVCEDKENRGAGQGFYLFFYQNGSIRLWIGSDCFLRCLYLCTGLIKGDFQYGFKRKD